MSSVLLSHVIFPWGIGTGSPKRSGHARACHPELPFGVPVAEVAELGRAMPEGVPEAGPKLTNRWLPDGVPLPEPELEPVPNLDGCLNERPPKLERLPNEPAVPAIDASAKRLGLLEDWRSKRAADKEPPCEKLPLGEAAMAAICDHTHSSAL
mmetsp:Transcript_108575/g.188559  ORF Transcript_108575/g.188559 Transcript_108575/m.188559 type:complete len:153 (+) Transcript_108575:56-514(+)